MSSSVGGIIPNIWKVIKVMFQTTNQYNMFRESIMANPRYALALVRKYTQQHLGEKKKENI